MTTAFEKEFSRVDFLKGSGALVVALGLPLGARARRPPAARRLPARPSSTRT